MRNVSPLNGSANIESDVKSTTALDSAAIFALVTRQRRKRPAWLLPLTMAAAGAVVLAAVSAVVLLSRLAAPPAEGPEPLRSQSEPAPLRQGEPAAEPAGGQAASDSASISPPAVSPPPAEEQPSSAAPAATRVTVGRLRTIIDLIDPGKPGEPDPL